MEYVNQFIENRIVTDVGALKYKAIQQYMTLINYLAKGHKKDYQHILEIISLIDIYSELDKRTYYKELYLNGHYN